MPCCGGNVYDAMCVQHSPAAPLPELLAPSLAVRRPVAPLASAFFDGASAQVPCLASRNASFHDFLGGSSFVAPVGDGALRGSLDELIADMQSGGPRGLRSRNMLSRAIDEAMREIDGKIGGRGQGLSPDVNSPDKDGGPLVDVWTVDGRGNVHHSQNARDIPNGEDPREPVYGAPPPGGDNHDQEGEQGDGAAAPPPEGPLSIPSLSATPEMGLRPAVLVGGFLAIAAQAYLWGNVFVTLFKPRTRLPLEPSSPEPEQVPTPAATS